MPASAFTAPLKAVIPITEHQFVQRRDILRGRWVIPRSRHQLRCVRMAHDKISNEPVEDGVTLPTPQDQEELTGQATWLQNQLTRWLDSEWQQSEHQPVHDEIGMRVARIYSRQRMEGEHDLSSVMLAIGSELEGMDFSQTFVGPWNVANHAAELLLEHCAGERMKWKPSFPRQKARTNEHTRTNGVTSSKKRTRVVSPSLADSFERMKFLQDVLDGSAAKELIDGAVAVAVGYRYDMQTGKWDGSQVEDAHFQVFPNEPPDILGDENGAAMTETLEYLDGLLKSKEESDEFEDGVLDGLQTVMETLHGTELTRIQMNDPHDHAFKKRMIVAKWLHLLGGF